MRIVILGAPGSGKRTQTGLLANKYGLSPVMTGELVKSAVMEQTTLGVEIKELQDAGRVVTEDIILALLRERLLKSELQSGFVLDGFPRNLLQALTLDELMVEIGLPLDLILLIDIETDNLMERLVGRRTCRNCGLLFNIYRNPTVVDGVCDVCGGKLHQRSDDNEETVSSRIHVFDHLISPLITHYEKQNKLIKIDGNGDVEQVFSHICKAIEEGVPPPSMENAVEKEVERQEILEGAEEALIEPSNGDEGDAAIVREASAAEKEPVPTIHTKSANEKTSSQKGAKKKSAPKKVAKKKTVSETPSQRIAISKKGSKERAIEKKHAQKKPSIHKVAKKNTKTSQTVKKKSVVSNSSQSSTGTQSKKQPAKSKKRPEKKRGSSQKTAVQATSKRIEVKKQSKKKVQKKGTVKKVTGNKTSVKKTARKKANTPRKKR